MDVVSHGLWGGALFYAQGRKKCLAGVLLGMAPDLLSFGVFHVMHPGWLSQRLVGKISGPPALTLLPPYVFHAYNITHSLVVWAVALFALDADEKAAMALGRLAIAYSLRYSDTRGELLPNAFPMAVSDTIRGRCSVVYAVVHGGQLRHFVHCLLLSIPLFPQEKQLDSEIFTRVGHPAQKREQVKQPTLHFEAVCWHHRANGNVA